ncbi:MAG TPA: hypothetical protein VJL29_16140, partial [Thermoguttaceae bacterium]|nr:hypothetical protein [Thermoguttaceae bacterium]
SASQSSGAPRRLGEWYPNQDAGEGQPGPPGSQASREKPRHRQESLAEKRGKDWAMPDGQPRATAVTQPIRIDCYADRLVLVPQRGLAGGRSVALGPQTRDAMDELVTAIWNYTEGWGMAGKGMYWRPVLHFYVYPGAEGRYRDVEDLLRDSGLPVEQKNQLQKP